VIVSPPPPPTLVVPAAHQVSYGIVRGVAASGARRLIVRIDGKVRRREALRRRVFVVDLDLPLGPHTVRVETVDVRGRVSATTVHDVYGLPRSARPRLRAARLDRALQRSLRRMAQGFGRTSAIYVQSLTTGQGAAWNARATFPAASTLKLAIAVTALVHLDGPPRHGSTLDALFRTMLISSDNGAANRLETLIGGSTSGGSALVNATMSAIGLERTEMYGGYILNTSLGPTRELAAAGIPLSVDDQPAWGTGKTTTAYDLARLARAIWLATGGLGPLRTAVPGFTPGEARYLLRVLADVRDHAKLDRLFGVRSGVKVFHKAGWIGTARHDNGLVFWQGGVFVATVMTYRSGGAGTASDVLAGRVAAAARDRFAIAGRG
jgi:beta-lactamase class A